MPSLSLQALAQQWVPKEIASLVLAMTLMTYKKRNCQANAPGSFFFVTRMI